MLQEPPALTIEQPQILIRLALEMDEPPLAPEDEASVTTRLAALGEKPASAGPPDEMKARLRSRFSK